MTAASSQPRVTPAKPSRAPTPCSCTRRKASHANVPAPSATPAAPASESYLNIPNIISAATITGCDAIHPGYGFLAENADFAEICEQCKITFIGPRSKSITSMGDKAKARQMAVEAGVPVLPGTSEPLAGVAERHVVEGC